MKIYFKLFLGIASITSGFSVIAADISTPMIGSTVDIPNLQKNKVLGTVSEGNFVGAPIPFSNPTIKSGIAGAIGYFYPQSEEERLNQPPSVTGGGAFYSSNDSWGLTAGHAAYLDNNSWIVKGGLGYAQLKLPLVSGDEFNLPVSLNWDIDGLAVLLDIEKEVFERWYIGLSSIYIDLKQDFDFKFGSLHFDVKDEVKSVGLGVGIIYDGRDMPTNPYEGLYFKFQSTFYDKTLGSDNQFESNKVELDTYLPIGQYITVALAFNGCHKSGDIPLWGACTLGLRGFSATEYMAKSAIELEGEMRWRISEDWGIVAFLGAGKVKNVASQFYSNNIVSSYGLGVRYMIQPIERINLRLDYARSGDDDAVYFSIGEAF